VRLQIEVDDGLCAGARRCEHLEPGLFQVDARGIARVVAETPAELERAAAVAEQCPNAAIVVRVDGVVVAGGD
jgi:ferredoxin